MTQFISCDWGTSRFRLRLVDRQRQQILAEHATDEGVQNLIAPHSEKEERRKLLETVLDRGLAALGVRSNLDIPVVISGMASSTLGWQSLPYASLPAPIDGSTLRFVDFLHAGRKVRLVSGLQAASDVMRGEETELIGLFASPCRLPLTDDSIVVMPGSHSKHVRLRAGQIVGFTTYLTGELYGLLSQKSTLEVPQDGIFDPDTFVAGARSSKAQGLSAALFQTRARAVLGRLHAKHSGAFLSGVLVGGEIGALAGTDASVIVLVAGDQLATQYVLALNELLPGAPLVQISPDELAAATVAGHARMLSYP